MAASIIDGDPHQDMSDLEPNGEEDVLCELNAEFRRSKCELIHRFLKDQEELNRKFAEYELDSDDNGASEESGSPVSKLPSGSPDLQEPHEIFDVLQDLEDKDLPDNLSIASAVNSSSDERSLSDCGDRASYEDGDAEEDERELDENWNITQNHGHLAEMYSDEFYDQYSRQGVNRVHQDDGLNYNQTYPLEAVRTPPQPQPRKSKKTKDSGTQARKVKKVLVKKNTRPQTSMGVRALPEADIFFKAPESDLSTTLQPKTNIGARFTFHDSLNVVGARFKKISWTGGTEDHPELARLSISASVHKLPPRSHTPGGRLKTCSSPLVPTRSLSLRGSADLRRKVAESGQENSLQNQPEMTHIRRSKIPVDLLELSRTASPVRPDSSLSNCSRLSVDIGPEHFATYRSRQGTPTTTGPHLMRSVYSAERGNRIVMTPTSMADVKGSKKRPIAVLKLPPLDSGVVNRAIGASLDSGGRQPPLVSPPTAKSNTVATPSAI